MRHQQFQNANTDRKSTQQLYQQHRDSPGQYASHRYGSEAASDTMDTSQFDDFSFPYASLPEHSPSMSMPDHVNTGFDDQTPDAFSHHPTLTSMPASQARAFGADSDPRRESIGSSDDGSHDRTSLRANSLDETVADEFGLPGHGRADGTDLGGKTKDDKNDAPPAWSELKTKAGKDRKRLPLACIACRRKKIRCSGEKPACKHCMRSRIPCVYKVAARKAAPRTDYMAMLDKRLKRMEERIIKIVPKADQDTAAPVTRAVVKPTIPGGQHSGKAASKKRTADEAFAADLEAWAKAPSKAAPATDGQPNYSHAVEVEENQLFREGIEALPSKDVQEHLAEVFFDNVYGQAYQLLHKPSYIRKLKSNALPPVLVLSVCAVAARFTGNPKLTPSATRQFLRGEEWASHARDICTRRYEWPNITILTCLLILGLHEFGTCHGGRSWALGGQAIRMAFALQLHKDLEYDPTSRAGRVRLSFIDREIRRRIMWGCFLMDRFNSSGTDRPMFIKEETVKIPLPVKERFFQLDMPAETELLDGKSRVSRSPEDGQMTMVKAWENMGIAAYTIRSVALWGRIITYLNHGGKEMDSYPMWNAESEYARLGRDAEALQQNLPEALQFSRDNLDVHVTEASASQFLLLHISMQQNTLFMNQAAVTSSTQRMGEDAPKDFLAQASAKTFAAANRISDLLKGAEESQCCVSAPFAGYCAFSSTTIHILGIFSGNPTLKATAEANSSINIKFLQKMMKYWGMFHWMVENIRTQYRDALNAARAGGPTKGAAKSSPILQYADWFNRYPHGILDTDMMDPAVHNTKETGEDAVLGQKPELQSVEEFFTTLPSPQTAKSKELPRSAGSKRKAALKKQANASARADSKSATTQAASKNLHLVNEQAGIRPQTHRRPSAAPAAQNHAAAVPFNSPMVPQSQDPSYHTLAAMSSTHLPHYSHQALSQQPSFSTDMLLMNLSQQQNGLVQQPLDRQQLLFGEYPMEAGGIPGDQGMMEGLPEWDNMASNTPADVQMNGRRDAKGPRINGRQPQGQEQQMMPDSMNGFGGADAASWFMPFSMDPPESEQDLGGGNIDALGVFNGGMATPNPLDGLRHCL